MMVRDKFSGKIEQCFAVIQLADGDLNFYLVKRKGGIGGSVSTLERMYGYKTTYVHPDFIEEGEHYPDHYWLSDVEELHPESNEEALYLLRGEES